MYFTTDLVPKFSARDKTYSATKFITKIEDYGERYGWTQRGRLLVARLSLTGTALLWLRSEETFRTWNELKKALEEEFPDDVASSSLSKSVETSDSISSEESHDTFLTLTQDGATVMMTCENVEDIIDSCDNELTQDTQVTRQLSIQIECHETDFTNSKDLENHLTANLEEVTQLGESHETYDVEEAIIERKGERLIRKTPRRKPNNTQKEVDKEVPKKKKKKAEDGCTKIRKDETEIELEDASYDFLNCYVNDNKEHKQFRTIGDDGLFLFS